MQVSNLNVLFTLHRVYYYVVDSPRNEGKDFFEINLQSGEIFTKVVFDREKQGAYALEVEARDGAPSARPNSNQQPNSGKLIFIIFISTDNLCNILTSSLKVKRILTGSLRGFYNNNNKLA